MANVTGSTPSPVSRAMRRWLPVGILGLGALAGILLTLVIVTRPGEPVGQARTTPTVAATPSASPASADPSVTPDARPTQTIEPTATLVPSGAARVAWGGGERHDGWVSSVIRFGDRWIAGGSSRFGAAERATIWISADGREWSEALAIGPEPDEHTRFLVSGFGLWDGYVLAMGWRGSVGSDSGSPMLWRSSDGDRWEEVDIDGTPYDVWQLGHDAVLTPNGSLAVVSMTGLGPGASAFLTSDLATWDAHPITDPSTDIGVTGVAAGPDLLMSVGREQLPYEDDGVPRFTQHAWISTDAVSWTAITPPADRGALADVTWDAAHGRFVAVGTDEQGIPHAWLTTDGAGWSAIPLGTSAASMQSVSAIGGLLVATGVSGPPFEPETGETLAWSSFDGVTWWYAPVLDWQGQTHARADAGSAMLIANQWTEERGETWISLAGPATLAD